MGALRKIKDLVRGLTGVYLIERQLENLNATLSASFSSARVMASARDGIEFPKTQGTAVDELRAVAAERDALKSEVAALRANSAQAWVELTEALAIIRRSVSYVMFRAEAQPPTDRTATFEGRGLKVSFLPHETYPYTSARIEREDGAVFQETLTYAHLALGKMLTEYDFTTVLEVGSGNGAAARAFTFCGKDVHSVDIDDQHNARYVGDYLEVQLSEKVDAIWSSMVGEHQRYFARFLEKMYDDLKDNGLLVLSLPNTLSPVSLGHVNIFTPMHVVYQLICAGFDCAEARVKTYDWQFSIIVRKKPSRIPRLSFGATYYEHEIVSGRVPDIISFFPRDFQARFDGPNAWGEIEELNWAAAKLTT